MGMLALVSQSMTVRGNGVVGEPRDLRFEYTVRGAHRDELSEAGGQQMNMGANICHRMKGQAVWKRWDPNGFELTLSIESIKYEFPEPQPVHRVPDLKIKPFLARVVMAHGDGGKLSIDFVQGRDEDPYGGARQYTVAHQVLDILCATVVHKEFESVPEASYMVSLEYPASIEVDGRKVSARREILSYRPQAYRAVPKVSADGVRAVELTSFESSKRRIRLAQRILDLRTGLALEAVNLDAVQPNEAGAGEFRQMIELLNKPHEFEQYTLYQFQATIVSK